MSLSRHLMVSGAAFGVMAAMALPGLAAPQAGSAITKVFEISWEDLWPAGEDAKAEELLNSYLTATGRTGPDGIPEGSAADKMPQIGTFNTVAGLNGKKVRLAGYVVPLDFSAKDQHTAFLLVPYFGACIHTPPPPPNQIVYVAAKPAAKIANIWTPVWVEGVISTTRTNSDLADAAYSMTLTRIEPYER